MSISATPRAEWYVGDLASLAPVAGLPGTAMLNPERWRVHRSHLPLLVQDADAARILTPNFRPDWAARDLLTQDRGFTLRNVQHAGVDFISQRRGVLLGDDMRVGKGHPRGTRVLGPKGWCNIEDVRVGDQVFGADGNPVKITGVFPRGMLPVFRVGFSDGSTVRVDGDHLWTTWDHNDWHRGKPPRTLSTAALAPQLRDANNLRWRIPLVEPLAFPWRALPIDPYLLGVLLGDGSLTQGSISFCCGDEDVPREVERVLPAGVRLTCTRSNDRAPTWRIIGQNTVFQALRDLGLWGSRSGTKFVPIEFLHSSATQRLALLQGLLDTDGEWSGDRLLQFSSASEELRNAVRFLVESLGGVARASLKAAPKYTYNGKECIGQPSYRLTLALPPTVEPFRARAGYLPRKKFQPTRHIKSIEADGEAEVVCISVDAPDQLYVTEHCIVTHNTLSCIMSHDPASGPLVVICPAMVRPVWIGWLQRVFPGEPIGVLKGRTFDHKIVQHKLVVGHYEVLPYWQSSTPIGTLVFDEAHMLTNRNAQRSKAAVYLGMRAQRVIAATGTPIWNMPTDLWNVLGLVVPGAFGGYHEFANRYGLPVPTAHGTKYTGISYEEELNARLSEIMIRRRWIDVVDDLPAITRNVSLVELDDAQKLKLDLFAAELYSAPKATTIGILSRYRSKLATIKRAAVLREAETMLARGEPVVIWTWHVKLAEQIAKALGDRAFLLTGEVSNAKRDDAIAAWKTQPAAALVCTMSVAQVGLDFSHAHLAIFAEIDYTPAILAQAEMRTYAPTRAMNITYIVADHLIDQRITLALTRKLAASNPLGVGPANEAVSALSFAIHGPVDEPDMDRLLEDFLAS